MGGRALILLDTHVLVWMDQGDAAIGRRARQRIQRAYEDGELAVSAISFWEVAMLVEKGRIAMERSVLAWRRDLLEAGLVEHPIDGAVGVHAASLEDLHGDPADRIIAATAAASGATLVTADRRLLDWSSRLRRLDAQR